MVETIRDVILESTTEDAMKLELICGTNITIDKIEVKQVADYDFFNITIIYYDGTLKRECLPIWGDYTMTAKIITVPISLPLRVLKEIYENSK